MTSATDNRTTEMLREAARNIQGNLGRCLYRRKDVDEMQEVCDLLFEAANTIESLRDRLDAAKLGCERGEAYNAGFDNGVKACLQILDGYLDYPHSALENISKWVDEQWKEYES